MNNVYIYDSSQIHVYETEDFGSITDVAATVVDHGVKMFDYIVQDGTPGVVNGDFIVPVGQDYIVNEVTGYIDYEDVWITETLYPVSGNINFSGGEENSATIVFVATAEPIILRERAIVIRKQAWIGSGSLFEIGSGLERMVAPYIGGSGTLPSIKYGGAGNDSTTSIYNEDAVITYGSDVDYGSVSTAVGSSNEYGQITGIVTGGETDNGNIVDFGGSNPFGLFNIKGIDVLSNSFRAYSGSGSLRLRGSVDEALDEPFNQIYIVGRDVATGQFIRRDVIGLRFHGGNPEAFARVGYQGSGVLFGFNSGDEAKVYDYTTESAVTLEPVADNGSVTTSHIDDEDYGQVTGIVTGGELDNGSITIKQTTRAAEGFFSVSGIAQSVRNRHHVGSGSISIAKHIDSYGEGQSSDIAFLPHYRSRGGITLANHIIPDAFGRIYTGSGSLFEIGQKDERAVFSYKVGSIPVTVTVPEIVLAPWNGTSAYTGSNISAVASGNGSGSSGGFNSSTTTYWRFTGQGSSNNAGANPRILTLGQLDLTNYNQFEFTAIAGTSSNGGENCDPDEDLQLWYSTNGGFSYTYITKFDAEDVRFTGSTFSLVTVDIPEAAKTSNVVLKFQQDKHSGSAFDQWGIEYVKLLESTTVSSGSGQVYDTIDSVDQGTVDQSAGTNEDYGTITEPFTNGIQDYGQLIPGFFKFGNINISGRASIPFKASYHGSGVLNPTGGRATVQFAEPAVQVYSYGLIQNQTSKGEFFKIVGGMSPIITVKGTYYTSGTLFSSGGGIESTVFDYNDSSIATVETPIDNGQITSSSGSIADYGQITEYGLGETDFGQVGIFQTTKPFGKLYELSGGDIAHSNPVAYLGSTARISITGGYSNLKFVSQAGESTALFEIRNGLGGEGNTYANVKPFIGSGSLFHIGDRLESKTYSYTTSSIQESKQYEDRGIVSDPATVFEDHGIEVITNEYDPSLSEDYGDVSDIIGDENPFGLYRIYGAAEEQYFPTFNWNRQSPPIRIFNDQQDPADFRFRPHWRTDTTTTNPPRISNGPGGEFHTYAQARPFIGGGRLFGLGDKFESATFRYTTESIVVIETPVDYGGLDNADPVTLSASELTNLQYSTDGDVVLSQNGNGSGSGGGFAIGEHIRFASGSGSRWFRFTYDTALYNQIEITGIKGNGSNGGEEPDSGEDLILQYLDGGGSWVTIDTIIAENDTSFNTLSTVVIAIPQAAQNNGQAFRLYQVSASGSPYDHYGISSIKFAETSSGGSLTEDYGQITDVLSGGEFDYGQVGITQTTESATGLYQLSGKGFAQFLRGPYVAKDGIIKIYKGKSAPTDFRFMPHWRSRPYEQGKLTGIAETSRSRDFVGAGRLFNLGDKFERATWNYNSGSVEVFETPENYGSITDSAQNNLDYGQIDQLQTGGDIDNGQVGITQTTYPLTGLFSFTGASTDQFFRGPYVAKEGFIRFYKGQSAATDFRFMPHWRGVPDEQFKVSGSAETPRGRDFVGTGSLFKIGDKIEKKVYNYTTESIEVVESAQDFGSITTTAGTVEDYGTVGGNSTGDIDYGQVNITHTTQPFGLFRFSGEGAEVKSSTPPAERFEISISGSAIERVTSGDDENTILFNFTGSLTESFSKGLYSGSGSLFHIGDRIERRTYHYNTSSVVAGTTDEDLGTVGSTHSTAEDYGSVTNAYLPPTIDHGDLVILPGKENPFGLFRIAGGDSGHKQTFAGDFGGSLFTAGSSAEVVGFNPPEETFLFGFSGAAVEKHVENYVGSGFIKYPEDTPLAPNAAVRFRPHWRGAPDHSPKILGTAVSAFKGAYVSKGVFSRMYTHDKGEEWLRYRPSPRYVNSIYGKIGGSAFVNGDGGTRKISVFGYYGDDRDPGTSGSLFGIGGAAESRGITPPLEDTVIFTLNGTAASKFNPHWRGRPDGSPRLYGTPELQLLFNIFTNPEGEKFNVYGDAVPVRTINYDGSGTLFTAGSSAEVVGFNPDIETRAFKFSGEPIVRIRVILFGGGSMFGFGSGAESTTIAVPESTVLFVPSGAAVPVITLNYDGSGTEVISGTATEKRTASHVGDGSLFGTGGAAEAVAVSEAESTALFVPSGGDQNSFTRTKQGSGSAAINGNAVPVITLNFSGSGSLFSIGGAAESATVAEESTGLFEFNGTAEPVIRTRGFAGSGSLFSIGGGEEIATVAEESTGLFTVSGKAQAPFARTKIGSGTTFVSGDSKNRATRIYAGEGQLSTFGGGAEVVGFNPAEETVLYEFGGTAEPVIRTRGFNASGSASVSGEAVPVITLNFIGSGNLTTFGGGAESRTIDVENTTLFETRGGATESFTKGNYDTEGSTKVSGEATDIKLTFGNEVFAYVSASGNADESKTDDYVGSGSLFSVVSTTIARTIDYDETSVGAQGEVVSTSLFRISGENPGSVTRITQPTTAEFRVGGVSDNKVILFSPPRTYSTII